MLKTLGCHVRNNVVGYVAIFLALGGTTYAATGGNFILGQSNSATSTTGLSAGTTGPAFRVTNTSTGTGGSFNVASGHAPFAVNSGTKVANLNADKLDGLDSTQLVSSSSLQRIGPSTLAPTDGNSTTVTLASIGQLTFQGYCFNNVGGNDAVEIFLTSSVAHSTFGSITQAAAGTAFGQADMVAGTGYIIAVASVSNGTLAFNPITGSAVTPGGQEVVFNLYQGVNARNQDGQCVFGGSFVVK